MYGGRALEPFEVERIVRVDDVDLAAGRVGEGAELLLVAETDTFVDRERTLHQLCRDGRKRGIGHLVVREERVARVEDLPLAIGGGDDDARVAVGVTEERHEEDVFGRTFEPAHVVEALPPLAAALVRDPLRPVRDLCLLVAMVIHQPAKLADGFPLAGVEMHFRVRKIGETARVIAVEVRDRDVSHVLAREPERLDLPQYRLLFAWLVASDELKRAAEALVRQTHVVEPEARVDDDEAVARLEHEAVADHRRSFEPAPSAGDAPAPAGAHGAAVDVVYFHARSLRAKSTRKIDRAGALFVQRPCASTRDPSPPFSSRRSRSRPAGRTSLLPRA